MSLTPRGAGLVTCAVLTLVMLLGPSAGQAFAVAHVRFIQAQPGAPRADLEVSSGGLVVSAGGPSAVGQLTPYANVPAGSARMRLVSSSREGQGSVRLTDGVHYTIVALGSGHREDLRVYRDGSAKAGVARLRIIHLAPELGAPDIRLAGRVIAQRLRFREDTGYIDLTPGSYSLAVTAPHQAQPILAQHLALAAGTATSAIITGTGGAPEQILVAQDDTLAPGAPPETGLGGLAGGGGDPWLAIALAALAGGALGGAVNLARRRRAGRA